MSSPPSALALVAMLTASRRIDRRRGRVILASAVVLGAACVSTRVAVQPVNTSTAAVDVRTPVKAHMRSGETIVYARGVRVSGDTLRGAGERFGLDLTSRGTVHLVALDSVVGMESYSTVVNKATSLLLTVGGIAVAAAITAGAAVALFGSCPTVYSDSAGVERLEAETFSYSIAPLFEVRDVDRLRVVADADGIVRLEVRNEALETHFLNHLELLEIRHGQGETVLPTANGSPLAITGSVPVARITDRVGRELRSTLAGADDIVFATDDGTLRRASAADMDDWIDITLPRPAGVDSVAVSLRMRNSLLNTVLFYDMMLGAPGARSLDWLGDDMARVGSVTSLARWYVSRMGLRVSVRDRGHYRVVDHIPDAGPIAWRDVATVVPVPDDDSLRIRLSFVADGWRLDRVRVADRLRRPSQRSLPLHDVAGATGASDSSALASMWGADERYLQTTPGQRFTARFLAGPIAGDSARTFLLASQGYYTEWVRGSWIRSARDTSTFVPSDDALLRAVAQWRREKVTLEQTFYSTRIPTP